jgi:hypothetical protein
MKGPGERAAGSPPRHCPSPPRFVRTSEGEWAWRQAGAWGRVAVSEVGPPTGDETVMVPSTPRSRPARPACGRGQRRPTYPVVGDVDHRQGAQAAHLDGCIGVAWLCFSRLASASAITKAAFSVVRTPAVTAYVDSAARSWPDCLGRPCCWAVGCCGHRSSVEGAMQMRTGCNQRHTPVVTPCARKSETPRTRDFAD